MEPDRLTVWQIDRCRQFSVLVKMKNVTWSKHMFWPWLRADEEEEASCRVRKVISALREGLPHVNGSVVRLSQPSGSTRRDEPAPWASRDQ